MATMSKTTSIHFTTLKYILMYILLWFEAECIQAQSGSLPTLEYDALRDVAKELGKTDWDFSLNPCDENANWITQNKSGMPIWYNNTLICNCSYPDSVCHVEAIYLTAQDLAGVLPPSLSKLSYLKHIVLTMNYLSGNIPPEWMSLELESMHLSVNRLAGPIPKFLGNMTSLLTMSLEANEFSGTIPPELGNLSNLTLLNLKTNNLTGKLPSQLNNLKKLKQLLLSSNNLTGNLPNFRSWLELERLELQASGLQGPLPSSISMLTNLTHLKIAYLNGGGVSKLPVLCNMPKMKRMMLRSCNISGKIPECLSNMKDLQMLDLSFNSFQGEIPNLEGLENLEYMHLTSNSLTGSIPAWIMSKITNNMEVNIDLSYNDFNESSVPRTCPGNLNLFRSYRSSNSLDLGRCLYPCSKDYYSFHVNCGGGESKIGDMVYEEDEDSLGPAKFVPNPMRNWGTSSSGFFWDTQKSQALHFVEHNVSVLPMNVSDLYMTARLSPLSLTYYGRCLANGNYSVTLHFAEITFRNNHSYLSLGRRIFDVYIQGEKKLKDFNIEEEANGVDTPVNKTFKIMVTDKVLEIRFQHFGKGTTNVPYQGTYGPLISAISVIADFKPPNKRKTIMLIEIAASLVGLILILGVIGFCFWNYYIGRRIAREKELRGLDLHKGFTYRQIKAATNSFDPDNKIGEGGFGCVYKGILLDGSLIAVKQLTSKSNQGNRGFVNELGMISALHHPNIVELYGCCIEGSDLLLVYEYMENNSLARVLFGPDEYRLEMDWPTRKKICIGIAKGLAYMHEESTLKIVHRDIKAGNVLLDKDVNPKISDFGLAKLYEDEGTHISTRSFAGTVGYMAPEYAKDSHLTYKADVYSFGIVALEIVTGRSITKLCPGEEFISLLEWVFVLHTNGGLMDLVDPKLRSDDLNTDEVDKMVRVSLLCTSQSPARRPTMSQVVSILEGHISVREFNVDTTNHPMM